MSLQGPVPQQGAPAGPGTSGPARAYDPTMRTTRELALDRNPAPRPGETAAEAQARAADAEVEFAVRVYDALGEQPGKMNVGANDAAHPGVAHTIDRHGPQVPLRRSGVPAGTRTLEGRIYGDAPWGNPANYSYRWISESTMNRAVNDYVSNNWNAIRSDLALSGRHQKTFDYHNVVGEGFYNANVGNPGPRRAVYSRTSHVTITLELPAGGGAPIIVRAFPNGRGS